MHCSPPLPLQLSSVLAQEPLVLAVLRRLLTAAESYSGADLLTCAEATVQLLEASSAAAVLDVLPAAEGEALQHQLAALRDSCARSGVLGSQAAVQRLQLAARL